MANGRGKSGSMDKFYFLGLQNHCGWWLQPCNQKTLALWKESYCKPRQYIKEQRHHFANKRPCSQSYGFSSIHVWMWELNHKSECWRTDTFKSWCQRRLLRVPWAAMRSNQSILKQISPEYSLEGLFAEVEASIHWLPDVKSQLIGKDPEAGKDWRQKEKGVAEDEIVR